MITEIKKSWEEPQETAGHRGMEARAADATAVGQREEADEKRGRPRTMARALMHALGASGGDRERKGLGTRGER